MVKKALLSGLLFCCVTMFVSAQEVVFTFEPLRKNERLAFKTTDSQGWLLSLYAQDLKTQAITRYINAWDDSSKGAFQYANNSRDCFFSIEPGKRSGYGRGDGGELYKVKGEKGVVIRIFNDVDIYRCFSSVDGNFILYIGSADGSYDDSYGKSECVFSLYNGEKGELIHQFSWTVQKAQEGFFVTRKDDGSFTLVLIGEAGYLYAEAEFDPVTLELKVLWDKSDDENFVPSNDYGRQVEDPLGDTVVIDPAIEEIAEAGRAAARAAASSPVAEEPKAQTSVVESPPPAVVTEPEPALEPETEHPSRFHLLWVIAGLGTVLLGVIIAVVAAKRKKKERT